MNIYFDNNATTAVGQKVFDEMLPYFRESFGNPSSMHSFGRDAVEALNCARQRVAQLLNSNAENIIFTGSGTEANNLAISGIAARFAESSSGDLGHIITSSIEHSSVLNVCRELEKNGVKVTYLPVGIDGIIDRGLFEDAISDNTFLVSIMLANNETGTVQSIRELAKIAHTHNIIFHTDAVQSVGKMRVDVEELGVDLLSLSAHKIYGPKGVGALYIRKGLKLKPLLFGGAHEKSLRPGTENVPGIVGLGKACEMIKDNLQRDIDTMQSLKDYLIEKIKKCFPDAIFNGSLIQSLPNTLNVSFSVEDSASLVALLDEHDIAVGSGAACRSATPGISHVLKAMKISPERRFAAIRISFSKYNTIEEIDYFIDILTHL